MNLLNNQPAYSLNYRSPDRICKNIKRHFADPSLAALLNLNKDKLIGDLKTFGLLFEALVERDLNIYMNYLKRTSFKIPKKYDKKPKFMCVIYGYNEVIVKEPETGVYLLPITALKP